PRDWSSDVCSSDYRAVAPIIEEQLPGFRVQAVVLPFIEFVNRQQFKAVDAQRLQVRDLFAKARVGARRGDAGGGRGRKTANMRLVDNQVFRRNLEGRVSL